MIDVNLRGAFLTMKYAIPAMLERGRVPVVDVASAAALFGTPHLGGLMRPRARDLPPTNRTIALEYAAQTLPREHRVPRPHQDPDDGRWHHKTRLPPSTSPIWCPCAAPGTTEEIADAMLYLASDACVVHHRHRIAGGRWANRVMTRCSQGGPNRARTLP